jgi:hypothetical protein
MHTTIRHEIRLARKAQPCTLEDPLPSFCSQAPPFDPLIKSSEVIFSDFVKMLSNEDAVMAKGHNK